MWCSKDSEHDNGWWCETVVTPALTQVLTPVFSESES